MIATSKEIQPIYSVTPCAQIDIDGTLHSAYGISYRSGGILTTVEDISPDSALVSKMAEIFTLCELPYSRLWGAIDALLP